jgi:uncharacterized protein (TIGR00661 family)
MKILYGIQLTGNGHITRSVRLIKELKERGAEVDIIASGSCSQISIPYDIKSRRDGISLFYNKTGGIDWIKTIKRLNLKNFISDIDFDASGYDLAISDFEPVSAWSAKRHGIPSIGFGNQYGFVSPNAPRPNSPNKISEAFIKMFAKCDSHIALGYQKFDNFVMPPIIDHSLLDADITDEGFILVYLPSISNSIIEEEAKKTGIKWKIYSPDTMVESKSGLVETKVLSSSSFKKDLLSCSGVITASGFSTTSEALVLGKKLWSIPIRGQYEQLCNAIALRKMGVMTEEFSASSLLRWINEKNAIEYEWKDPAPEIAQKIIEEYGKDKNSIHIGRTSRY